MKTYKAIPTTKGKPGPARQPRPPGPRPKEPGRKCKIVGVSMNPATKAACEKIGGGSASRGARLKLIEVLGTAAA